MQKEYYLDVDLPGVPILPNRMKKNWYSFAAESTKWKDIVYVHCRNRFPKTPLKKASIIFIRYSSREPDFDNLVRSFKPVLDGLKGHIIEDDNQKIIGKPTYLWKKEKEVDAHIRIILTGMEET